MSVGAGSIKRAANAAGQANGGGIPNAVENFDKTAKAESVIQRAESRLAARKAAEGKPVAQKVGNVPIKTETTVKPEEKKIAETLSAADQEVVEQVPMIVTASADPYKSYGIGEQLPVYLL